eukprot:gene2882-3334_t
MDDKSIGFPISEELGDSCLKCHYHVIGDDAFPLRNDIMKPFPFRQPVHEQQISNYRLSSARRVVENAFGILANRFRVLLTKIALEPKKAEKVVLAISYKEELASEALVFTAVGNTGVTWKSIISYFFCNKVPIGVLAQLTRTSLNVMADAGFVAMSIIWDGTYVNQAAAGCLRCRSGCLYELLATAFPHPSCGYLVHVIFNIWHMLKLLRNTL